MAVKKLAKDRKRRNKSAKVVDLRLVRDNAIRPGPPRKEWYKEVKDWWEEFWQTPELVLGLGTIDVYSLRRLGDLYDLREQARRKVRKTPVVVGSTGQPQEHPSRRSFSAHSQEIRQLEDRFGLSPKARLLLQIRFGQAVKTIEDLLGGDDDDIVDVEVIDG